MYLSVVLKYIKFKAKDSETNRVSLCSGNVLKDF